MQQPRVVSSYEQDHQALRALEEAGMQHGTTASVDFRNVRTDNRGCMFFCTSQAQITNPTGTPDGQPLSPTVTHNLSRRRTRRLGNRHITIRGAQVCANGSTAITFTDNTVFIDEDSGERLNVTPNLLDLAAELVGVD